MALSTHYRHFKTGPRFSAKVRDPDLKVQYDPRPIVQDLMRFVRDTDLILTQQVRPLASREWKLESTKRLVETSG